MLQSPQRSQKKATTTSSSNSSSSGGSGRNRRSFGRAFAQLFRGQSSRSVGGASGRNSPPGPPQRCRTLDNNNYSSNDEFVAPSEIRPITVDHSTSTTTVMMTTSHSRESSTSSRSSQQPELAEEAEENCACSAAGSNGAGSSPNTTSNSKRPSLSEPALCSREFDDFYVDHDNDQTVKVNIDEDGGIFSGCNGQENNAPSGGGDDGNKPNLLRTSLSSFSSSTTLTTSTSSVDQQQRIRHHSSDPKASSHHKQQQRQRVFSRQTSLLESRRNLAADDDGPSCSVRHQKQSEEGIIPPNTAKSKIRLRNITMMDEQQHQQHGGIPRLSTSRSIKDFITQLNRIRFDSQCAIGEETDDEQQLLEDAAAGAANGDDDDGAGSNQSKFSRKESVQSHQESSNVGVGSFRSELRTRGYTVGGNYRRPPSSSSGQQQQSGASTISKWGNRDAYSLTDIADDDDDLHTDEGTTADSLDALFLLNSTDSLEPPAVAYSSGYGLFRDFFAAAGLMHSLKNPTTTTASTTIVNGVCAESADSVPSTVGNDHQNASETNSSTSTRKKKSSVSSNKENGKSSTSVAGAAVGTDQTTKDATISALQDQVRVLRAELAFVKQKAYVERHQRVATRARNRILHGQLKNRSAVAEQCHAQLDQLGLQEKEIRELTAALVQLRKQEATQRQEYSSKEFQLSARLQTIQRENETLRSSLMASKRTADELLVENRRLTKDLGSFVQRLCDKEAAYAQLQEKCDQYLPQSKDTIARLNNQLFVMGEQNRRLREQLKAANSHRDEWASVREQLRNAEESWQQESAGYRRALRKERSKAEAAHQRAQELEVQLQKRQGQIVEWKRRSDQLGDSRDEQYEAWKCKYDALLTACQRQEVHILELYDRLETKKHDDDDDVMINGGGGCGSVQENGNATAENGCNDRYPSTSAENGADIAPTGVDIPTRTGTTPEIRSYDSYHSIGNPLMVVHHQHPTTHNMVVPGSYQSGDLYLPYLFNHDDEDQDEGSADDDDGGDNYRSLSKEDSTLDDDDGDDERREEPVVALVQDATS